MRLKDRIWQWWTGRPYVKTVADEKREAATKIFNQKVETHLNGYLKAINAQTEIGNFRGRYCPDNSETFFTDSEVEAQARLRLLGFTVIQDKPNFNHYGERMKSVVEISWKT